MRRSFLVPWILLPGAFALAAACGSGDSGNPTQGDASSESSSDDAAPDIHEPARDTSTVHCTLGDGSDPVALCTQKRLLQAEMQDAYAKGKGAYPSWNYSSGTPDAQHDYESDLAFANAISLYNCSAAVYGDNEITGQLADVLADLAATLEGELPPDDYAGEAYFRLRNVAAGLFAINENDHANKIAAVAESFGRALQTKYARTPPSGGTVLGTDGGGGSTSYRPAIATMGAAVLLHMAVTHAQDDAGADAATWATTASATIDYVTKRGRDASGMFYVALAANTDPGHDAPQDLPPTLFSGAQSFIVLALVRAQDLMTQYQTLTAQDGGADGGQQLDTPWFVEAKTLVSAMNASGVGLWDGSTDPQATGPGAYLAGRVVSTGALVANKDSGTAWMLGGLHRLGKSFGSDQVYQLKQMRAALLQQSPANSSLLSVVSDQRSYFGAVSRDWHFAQAFTADGGTTGEAPQAESYSAEAVAEMVEGISQLWVGRSDAPQCTQ